MKLKNEKQKPAVPGPEHTVTVVTQNKVEWRGNLAIDSGFYHSALAKLAFIKHINN